MWQPIDIHKHTALLALKTSRVWACLELNGGARRGRRGIGRRRAATAAAAARKRATVAVRAVVGFRLLLFETVGSSMTSHVLNVLLPLAGGVYGATPVKSGPVPSVYVATTHLCGALYGALYGASSYGAGP